MNLPVMLEEMQGSDLKCSWVELQGLEGHTLGNGIPDILSGSQAVWGN